MKILAGIRKRSVLLSVQLRSSEKQRRAGGVEVSRAKPLSIWGEDLKGMGLCAKYPAVPWKEMAGMRDKVIHFYFGIDQEAVWLVVKDRIPSIVPLLEQILQDMDAG